MKWYMLYIDQDDQSHEVVVEGTGLDNCWAKVKQTLADAQRGSHTFVEDRSHEVYPDHPHTVGYNRLGIYDTPTGQCVGFLDLVHHWPLHVESEFGAMREPKGTRYDLIPPIGLRHVAETAAYGANKYGVYNWERGFPVGDVLSHAIAHITDFLAGDTSEDHLGHAAFNVLMAIDLMVIQPESMRDLIKSWELRRGATRDSADEQHPEGPSG